MVLPNRPFTIAEIKAALETPLTDLFKAAFQNESYDTVEYEAARNRVGKTTVRTIFIRLTSSPSDCTMMIPGTFGRRW